MLLKIKPRTKLQDCNPDTFPWHLMPVFSSMDGNTQAIISFWCDVENNPCRGMEKYERVRKVSQFLGIDDDDVLDVDEKINRRDTKEYRAAVEYYKTQSKPMHLALATIDEQIMSISMEMKSLSISIQGDDSVFERFLSFQDKLGKYAESRDKIFKSIGGEFEMELYNKLSNIEDIDLLTKVSKKHSNRD